MSASPLLCHRCGVELSPGRGDFYLVRIEALADPSGPVITDADLAGSFEERIEPLLSQARELSEREAMDQVYRRLTLHLCLPCYQSWIENPAGAPDH